MKNQTTLTLEQLKDAYANLLAVPDTEKRTLTAAEISSLDKMRTDIHAMEEANRTAANAAIAGADGNRSAAAAAAELIALDLDKRPTGEYLRSIAKGAQDVGNQEVIADVVREFNETSPIFAAHKNVQKRTTGMEYKFTQINKGSSPGYVKTEGNAGTTDATSTAGMVGVPFKTYSGESILVTQEAMDDYACDIGAEVIGLGMAKSTAAFAADAVTALQSAFLVGATFTPTQTAATTWAFSDVVNAYFDIPARNRTGASVVSYVCNSTVAKKLVALLTLDNSPQAAAIGFTKEAIVEDDAVPNDVLFVGDITKVLAIGMKLPVRVCRIEVSAGATLEAQPRLAVALRDGTAVAVRKLKP